MAKKVSKVKRVSGAQAKPAVAKGFGEKRKTGIKTKESEMSGPEELSWLGAERAV